MVTWRVCNFFFSTKFTPIFAADFYIVVNISKGQTSSPLYLASYLNRHVFFFWNTSGLEKTRGGCEKFSLIKYAVSRCLFCRHKLAVSSKFVSPWRNWLARSAFNRKVGGSSLPGNADYSTTKLTSRTQTVVILFGTWKQFQWLCFVDT